MPTQTLHFTLDETAGALLMEIAQEHLLYENNIGKAIDTITGSLTGCPKDLALELIHGTKVIYVIEEDGHQFFSVGDRPAESHIKFPKLDCAYYAQRNTNEIAKEAMNLRTGIQSLMNQMRRNGTCTIDFSYASIIKFIGGDAEEVLNTIQYDEEVSEIAFIVRTAKAFIEKSLKTLAIVDFMKKTWYKDFESDEEFFQFIDHLAEAHSDVRTVMQLLGDLMRQNYDQLIAEEADLQAYVDATIEIEDTIKKGLLPVNLMDNYSAGWLSPDGTYYALNGEIANMLHNQIAEALHDQGIIPTVEEDGHNYDNWLHKEGWVKIHGNNILFEGNLNKRAGRGNNVYMTKTQIVMIYKYIQILYMGSMRCTHQQITAPRFQMLAEGNPDKLYREYFLGDLNDGY